MRQPALCVLGLAFAFGACDHRTSTLGAFFAKDGGPVDDGRVCMPADPGALPSRLPIDASTLGATLPSHLPLGLLGAPKSFAHDLDAMPSDWSVGVGAYTASLSEFGAEGHATKAGWHELVVAAKVDSNAGTTDRKFWGAELASPTTFAHGLFLARVRRDRGQHVQSSFFFSNDRLSATGASLGWTGAILEFSDDGDQLRLNALFHDSASGRHDSTLVKGNVAPGEALLLGLLSLPGRVAFYVDGALMHEWLDTDTLPQWAFHFTHWINNPAPRAFTPSPTPVTFGLDFVAHYAVLPVCN